MLIGNGNDRGPYSVAVTLVILFISLRVSFTLAVRLQIWFRISCSEFLHVCFSSQKFADLFTYCFAEICTPFGLFLIL